MSYQRTQSDESFSKAELFFNFVQKVAELTRGPRYRYAMDGLTIKNTRLFNKKVQKRSIYMNILLEHQGIESNIYIVMLIGENNRNLIQFYLRLLRDKADQ